VKQWIGAIIILAAFVFAGFAFRQATKTRREDRSDIDDMPPVGPGDADAADN
jgi:uncharacterized membrane-anchored protein